MVLTTTRSIAEVEAVGAVAEGVIIIIITAAAVLTEGVVIITATPV